MDYGKVSVIVPIYKVEPYLDQCVQSIVNQTYKNLEIILVDDGSPDNSPAMCDAWAEKDNRIRVIHKENGGFSSARNAGLDAATGDYIQFVDSDDWILPDMTAALVSCAVEGERRCCALRLLRERGRRYARDLYQFADILPGVQQTGY